jgi:periplasmic protein TonB
VYASRAVRSGSALAALVAVAALAALMFYGLRVEWLPRLSESLVSVTFQPERKVPKRPPRPEVRQAARTSAPKDEASPRNLRNRATPVVALPVPILLPPPPVVTAPLAGEGLAVNTGASLLPGPGQGAGGIGNGPGGGGQGGEGDGDGGGERAVIGPRRIGGKLSMNDLPEGLLPPGVEATVTVLFRVRPDGRVSDCRIEGSSSIAALDALACRLIEQRFRYRPARGRSGKPVASRVIETHSWYAEPAPPQAKK